MSTVLHILRLAAYGTVWRFVFASPRLCACVIGLGGLCAAVGLVELAANPAQPGDGTLDLVAGAVIGILGLCAYRYALRRAARAAEAATR